jgi:hypothetical protein
MVGSCDRGDEPYGFIRGEGSWSRLVLAGVLCVRARRPISKGNRGMQIILKKFYQRENWGFEGNFMICRGKIRLDLD